MDNDTLLSGSLSVLNSGINYASAANLDRANREFSREMWQKQVDYNNDMWQRQADWSSPAQQLQRLKDAGLNPNLIYGQGVQASGETPKPTSPHPVPYEGKAVLDFNGLSALALQGKLIDSEVEKNRAEAVRSLSQATGQDISNEILGVTGMDTAKGQLNKLLEEVKSQQIYNRYADEMYSADLQGKKLANNIATLNTRKLLVEKPYWDANAKTAYLTALANLERVKAETNKSYAEISLIAHQEKYYDAMVNNLASSTFLNYEQAANIVRMYNLAIFNGETSRMDAVTNYLKAVVPTGETGNIYKIMNEQMYENLLNGGTIGGVPLPSFTNSRYPVRSRKVASGYNEGKYYETYDY